MGGWTNPASGLVPGSKSDAPLSTLLPEAPGVQPNIWGNTKATPQLNFQAQSLNKAGAETIGAGTSLLGKPLDYWQKLLQPPTRTSLAEQQGPAIASVVGQYSTGKKALAQQPRGGGTSATAAELPFQEAGAITGLLEQQLAQTLNVLQPEAAKAISGIAETLSSLGFAELGLGSQDVTTLLSAEITKRGQNMQALGGLGKGLGEIISTLITKLIPAA